MRPLTLILAATFAATLAGAAAAKPALDAAGKCRDGGKFVAASLCKAPAPAARCIDKTSKKFAKCGAPNAIPAPK